MLSLLGDGVNRLSVPFIGVSHSQNNDHETGSWAAIARAVMARPVVSMVLAGGLLIVLAIPYFSINLGASGPASIPQSYEVRRAFEILNDEFSAGRLSPTHIVVSARDVSAPADPVRRRLTGRRTRRRRRHPGDCAARAERRRNRADLLRHRAR